MMIVLFYVIWALLAAIGAGYLVYVGNTMLDAFYTVKERKKGDQNG